MPTASLSRDDELLARLEAPPNLRDGVESLEYWRARGQRLPWYRLGARREAARMIMVWEQRVRAALLKQRGLPLAARLRGARLIAATQVRRWIRRVGFRVAATTLVVLVLAPAVVAVGLLVRMF